ALVALAAQNYRDGDGNHAPDWAEYQVFHLYQSLTEPSGSYGDDYIAGGPADDVIFGQLGKDTIQGDGSIDGSRVYAYRDANNVLQINPSVDALATDGNDYIEGGGDSDVIF